MCGWIRPGKIAWLPIGWSYSSGGKTTSSSDNKRRICSSSSVDTIEAKFKSGHSSELRGTKTSEGGVRRLATITIEDAPKHLDEEVG